jgi:hypothetical protein
MKLLPIVLSAAAVSVLADNDVASMAPQFVRTNWGVVFNKVGTVLNGISKYRHTFAISIPSTDYTPLREINCDTDALKLAHCEAVNVLVRNVNDGFSADFRAAAENMKDVLSVIPDRTSSERRRKRRSPHLSSSFCRDGTIENEQSGGGFFSALGKMASDLFGTPNFDDIKIVDKHICELADTVDLNTRQIVATEDRLSSLSGTLDNEISSLQSGLSNMNDRITETQAKLINVTRSVVGDLRDLQTRVEFQENAQEAMYLFMGNLERFQHAALRHLTYVSSWMYGVDKLLEGYVPQELVSVHDVRTVLEHVQTTVLSHHSQLTLAHPNPSFYYRVRSTAFTKAKNTLFVMLTVPLRSTGGMLGVYRVDRTPVRTSEDLTSGTRVVNLPDFFALTPDLRYYTELSTAHFMSCRGDHVRICETERALQASNRLTCAAAIFFDKSKAIQSRCDIRFEANASIPEAVRLRDSQYLIHSGSGSGGSWTMHCPYASDREKLRSVAACGTCIINVPCGCSLDGDTFRIPLRLTGCDSIADELGFPKVTKIYPYNLPVLRHVYSDEDFSATGLTSGSARTMRPIKLSQFIGNLTDDGWAEVVAKDEKYRIDLKKFLEQSKKNTKVYADKAEYYLKKATDFHDLMEEPIKNVKQLLDGQDLVRLLKNPHTLAGGMTTLWVLVIVSLVLAIYNFCRGRVR